MGSNTGGLAGSVLLPFCCCVGGDAWLCFDAAGVGVFGASFAEAEDSPTLLAGAVAVPFGATGVVTTSAAGVELLPAAARRSRCC